MKIKNGMIVTWEYYDRYLHDYYRPYGLVVKLYNSGTGGKKNNTRVAKIKILCDESKYPLLRTRSYTTISLKKLKEYKI